MISTILNLTILHLSLNNVFRGPFLASKSIKQLSIYNSNIHRLFNPFFQGFPSSLKVFDCSFNRALSTVFTIENNINLLDSDQCIDLNESTYFFDYSSITICTGCNLFFGCCAFSNAPTAIKTNLDSLYSIRIKKCTFDCSGDGVQILFLPNNEQIIIEDSYFSASGSPVDRGFFIYSESSSYSRQTILSSEFPVLENSKAVCDENSDPHMLSYFALSRSFFGIESGRISGKTRDSISSRALFHDIKEVNMSKICNSRCTWGCCLGLNTASMIRVIFSKFTNNQGENLIWFWNLPDERNQKIYGNLFYGNSVTSLFFIQNDVYLENCIFSSGVNLNDKNLFNEFGGAQYHFVGSSFVSTFEDLQFNLDDLNKRNCRYLDPTSTPTASKSFTPVPKESDAADRTPPPSMSPDQTETPSRSPWPTPSPMPTSTPTATPKYMPLFGISFAISIALCIIIFIIVFFCRHYYHKSSEDTVSDDAPNYMSGVNDKSYSSETDPLNLNESSDDSVEI